MAILDPVSPFLALIDRIISLVKERDTKRREYFEKIIDPLYTQFKPLGEDYLKLFQEALQAIMDARQFKPKSHSKRKRAEAVSAIRKRREQFAATRAQLRALLEVCEQNAVKKKDEELAAFVRAMFRFFQPVVLTPRRSLGQELVDFFERWQKSDYSNEIAEAFLPSAAHRLEVSWYEISGRYMELKLKSLGE